MVDIIQAITAVSSCIASSAAVVGLSVSIRNSAKVSEVHTLVNSQADQHAAELEAMTEKRDTLIDAREEAHFRKTDQENEKDKGNGG